MSKLESSSVETTHHDEEISKQDEQHTNTFKEKVHHAISAQEHGEQGTKDHQVFSIIDIDPAMDKKMRLLNQAIEEIGWTGFHLKLFFLNGFGYFADSLLNLLMSITQGPAAREFHPSFVRGMTVAAYCGLLLGALFFGFSADLIGRRLAFNSSLFMASVFAMIAGAAPNWYVLGLFICLACFGAGGNLVLDATVFLEFLPSKHQWLLTLMACWWGLAPVVAAAFAWPLLSLPQFNCAKSQQICLRADNMGWRYIWIACGALVLVLSILRVTVVHLPETPKFLLSKGRDDEAVAALQKIAHLYNRPCSLTVEQFRDCGEVKAMKTTSRSFIIEIGTHLKGLFQTRNLAISTSLIWFSWLLIGLAYPLFYVFLPEFLASRGAKTGEGSLYYVWRNYMITNTCGIFGPILAGYMCNWKVLGRRYTLAVSALLAMVFFFAYTTVRTPAQNLGFTCAIYFSFKMYYGTLYAYTPEVLPSAHRTTGYGISIGCNRIMGLVSAFVATYANTATEVPIYLCAALYIAMAIVAVFMPFEPYGKKAM